MEEKLAPDRNSTLGLIHWSESNPRTSSRGVSEKSVETLRSLKSWYIAAVAISSSASLTLCERKTLTFVFPVLSTHLQYEGHVRLARAEPDLPEGQVCEGDALLGAVVVIVGL